MNGANPPAGSARGENVVRPQSWPFALKTSGGAPISRSISRSFGLVHASLPALSHADREVGDQANSHPGLFCRALCGGKRTIGDPLQKAMERSLARIRLCEPCHFRACRVAPRFGPIAPIPGRPIGGKSCCVQCFKLRMSGKQRSPGRAKLRKIRGQRHRRACGEIGRREILEQAPEDRHFGARGLAPVDQSLLLQFGRRCSHAGVMSRFRYASVAEQCSRVGMKGIVEEPARRRIRAEMVWIGSKQRVHGAERDGVCPKAGSLAGKRDDAGGVADAAIAGAAQAVGLHREPPRALLWCNVRDRVAARRRDRDRNALGS